MSKQYDTYIAVVKNQVEVLKCLLESVEASELRKDLMIVALKKNVEKEIIKILINHGVDVNQCDKKHRSPALHFAGDAEIAEALISKGAEVNKQNKIGNTPLMHLLETRKKKMMQSRQGVIEVLLANGANVSQPDNNSFTALLKAAIGNNYNAVVSLLDAGADVNQANLIGGETALMLAAERGFTPLVRLLLERGASTELETRKHGKGTALLFAAGKEGAVYTDVYVPPPARNATVQLLLEHGASVHAESEKGSTALFFATGSKMVKALVKAGADINKENSKGYTPLTLAIKKRKVSTVKALLKQGADPNVANKTFQTPLQVLMSNYGLDHHYTAECLLKAGAWKTHSKYCCSLTLPKLIVRTGQMRFVELLLRNGIVPQDVCRNCFFKHYDGPGPYMGILWNCEIKTFSPLKFALLCGNIEIAQFLVRNWFLTKSDFTETFSDSMFTLLVDLKLDESATFLKSVPVPLSLTHLSFQTVSESLGEEQGRKERVTNLGLPLILQSKLLFRTSDLLADDETKDTNTNSRRGRDIFQWFGMTFGSSSKYLYESD